MPALIPPSVSLLPPPPELRHRLAIALREVDLLRRLIRVAEHAATYDPRPAVPKSAERRGVAHG